MKKTIFAFLLALCSLPCHATTWYIRLDGGTATQCTGTTNAAYPGSGTGQACAYNHPYYLVTNNTDTTAFAWKIAGGDTVQFEDKGPYYIGLGPLNGLGTDWLACGGDGKDCVLPVPIPSGTSGNPTRILGKNAGSCSTYGSQTVLEGINAVFWMLDVQQSSWGDLECVEFTQPDNCTLAGQSSLNILTTQMTSGTATYGWSMASGANALLNQKVTVTGTTNGGGVFNVSGKNIATITPSAMGISQTQATGTTATVNWSLTSGFAPVVGQLITIAGTTNGGGEFNGEWQLTAVTGTTSGTMQFTYTGTTASAQAESGTSTNVNSGYFTITGLSGTYAQQAESGTEVPSLLCQQSVNNYASAGLVMSYLTAQGPSNWNFQDLWIDGIANHGILGSKLNENPGDVVTATNITVTGNGVAGWDNDGGGCGDACENVGTFNLDHVEVDWNGCIEIKPNGGTIGGAGYDGCYDDFNFGYGDGFAFIAAGNFTMNMNHGTFKYNTQDGFDGLHLSDDLTKSPQINLTNSYAEGNEGQTFKIGTGLGAVSTAINNVSLANCYVFSPTYGAPSMVNPLGPQGWNAGVSDICRAQGDQWALQLNNGSKVVLENNTSLGYSATMYDFECAYGGTCTTGTVVVFKNNLSFGYLDARDGLYANGLYFGTYPEPVSDPFANTGSSIQYNSWYSMRANTCPQNAAETNALCNTNPLLVSQSDINAANANLTSTSPQIGRGVTISGITTDYNGTMRPSPPSIGAYEFEGATVPTVVFGGSVVLSGGIVIQ